MTNWRLFPATNGPASHASYSGNFLAGVAFETTQFGVYFTGYWFWAPPGGNTSPQKFALWQLTGTAAGTLVPGSVVTSGTLISNQWNFTALPSPLPITANIPYLAETGYVASGGQGFPETKPYFGTGGSFNSGITNGPLFAYSDTAGGGGLAPVPVGFSQGSFGVASADPSVQVPNLGSDSGANFWVDLQLTDQVPVGATYRLWPNMPVPLAQIQDSALNFTLGTEFKLSQTCAIDRIWFYSPTAGGITQLPTETGIWDVNSQTVIAATHNTSPAWSGAAGSGWVSVPLSTSLPAGDYKVSVFNGAASPQLGWNISQANYWSTGGGGNGIVNGPLSAPNNAGAAAPGQSSYHQGTSFHWPDTNSGPFTYWIDVEVTPVASGSGLLMAQFPL